MSFNIRSKVRKSNYMKKEDCGGPGEGIVVTIERVEEKRIDPTDEDTSIVVNFKEEGVKPLILNIANTDSIIGIAGGETDADFVGTTVECFHEPNVYYAGKLVGGIRIRKPATASTPAPAPAETDFSDDIPF
ncbi:hypothetical protein N9H39_02045 [Gammaproteobacteria bacterium]|nr:hypothetical protein [Gammaproteobacteria bacterium]